MQLTCVDAICEIKAHDQTLPAWATLSSACTVFDLESLPRGKHIFTL